MFTEPDSTPRQHPGSNVGSFGRRPLRRTRDRDRRLPLEPEREVVAVRLRISNEKQLLQAGEIFIALYR